jgi:hypothetical protein
MLHGAKAVVDQERGPGRHDGVVDIRERAHNLGELGPLRLWAPALFSERLAGLCVAAPDPEGGETQQDGCV